MSSAPAHPTGRRSGHDRCGSDARASAGAPDPRRIAQLRIAVPRRLAPAARRVDGASDRSQPKPLPHPLPESAHRRATPLSPELLRAFDLVLVDGRTLGGLPAGEQRMLTAAASAGLGVVLVADVAPPPATALFAGLQLAPVNGGVRLSRVTWGTESGRARWISHRFGWRLTTRRGSSPPTRPVRRSPRGGDGVAGRWW